MRDSVCRVAAASAGLLGFLLAGTASGDVIDEPAAGAFVESSEIRVSGGIPTPDVGMTSARLNGVPLALADAGALASFDVSVAVDFDRVFNPLLVDWTLPGGQTGRERVTVVAGASTLDGGVSLESAALHFTETGLDAFEPALDGLVGFDLDELLPVGRRIYNKCLVDTFAGCIGRAKVYIDDPPPRFASQQVSLEPFVDGVQLDLVLREVRLDLEIRGSGVVPDCRLRLTAETAQIGARYDIAPDTVEGTRLDLSQSGALALDFDRFHQNFTGGACNDGLIEDVIDDIVGDLEGDILDALADLLEDPDGGGPADGPLTDVIEDALADVEITRPIAEALEVDLYSPVARVVLADEGVTLVTDTAVMARVGEVGGCDAPMGAPDFSASFEPDAQLPMLGSATPLGGLPFDVALALNDAALGQGLKALTECGLLHSDLEELELGGTRFAITAQLLSVIEPAFGSLPPALALTIQVRPALAPVLRDGAGPLGELAALRIADLRVDVVDPSNDTAWLQLAVDATTGLDIDFAPVSGELTLGTAGALADVEIVVLGNAIGADPAELIVSLTELLEDGTVSLSDELGTFRLPGFLGLELVPIEIARGPGSATFYFDAVAVPEPGGTTLAVAGLLGVGGLARLRRSASIV